MPLPRNLRRRLVVPPIRFHTATSGKYEYRNYSSIFDLAALQELHDEIGTQQRLDDELQRVQDDLARMRSSLA